MAVKSFTHIFNKHVPNTCYIPGTVVGSCIQLWIKQVKSLCSQSFYSRGTDGPPTHQCMGVRGERKRRGREWQRQQRRHCCFRRGAPGGHHRAGTWADLGKACNRVTGRADSSEGSEAGPCSSLPGGTAWDGSLSPETPLNSGKAPADSAAGTQRGRHRWVSAGYRPPRTAGVGWEYTGTEERPHPPQFSSGASKGQLTPKYITNTLQNYHLSVGFPRWCSGKESAHQCRRCRRSQFDPWVGKILWRRKWQPTLVFLLK